MSYKEIVTKRVEEEEPFEVEEGASVLKVDSHAMYNKVYILRDAEFICGAPTDDGSRCSIEVSEPGARCHHHE